jgi:non-specific serine/threonine protein kinase
VLKILACSADLTRADEVAAARAAGAECLAIFRAGGAASGAAVAQCALGQIALQQGDHAGARTAFAAYVEVSRALRDTSGVMWGLDCFAEAVLAQGDAAGAAAVYRESLALACASGWHGDQARSLEGLAAVAAAQRRWERAARLVGIADATWRAGDLWPPTEQPACEAAARAALGEAAFAAAWAEGQAMSATDAIEYALADADEQAHLMDSDGRR